MARETVVFISYARSDGESFANELEQRLRQEPDIALWRDRIRMAPGDFEQQIRQAIDSAEYLVVVLTPGALRSEWVEKEWRYARENGVCICPVKPAFESPSMESEVKELLAKWPRWMQQIQIFDFEGYWRRFVAVLQSPCQATKVPFLASSLPGNFVRRPAEAGRIVDGILDGGRKNPSGKRVVVYGSGGFGKTTLALDVCHNEDVFMACDGGVLWATVGAEPSPISELTKIYAALTGERPQFATLDDATFGVAQKLAGKRCLMVVDDVWEDEHLRPFLQGGEQCSRLITTRRFNIAVQEADAQSRVNVAEMKTGEAWDVLTARLEPPPGLRAEFERLAARLGEWPMLLQLANRTLLEQVALGDNIEGALNWANAMYDKMGVVAFDRQDATAREQAIAKSVELSLSLLREQRARCLELGIFPEDTDIPLEWIAVVWQRDIAATRMLAQRMHDLALIKLDLSRKSGAPASSGSVRLHDVMRAYFAGQLAETASLHGRLADAWKDPRRIVGDYALQLAAYHLAETMTDSSRVTERGRQLLDLLTDSRYRAYQEHQGDPLALHRQIAAALERATRGMTGDSPALVAALALLQKSYAQEKRDPGMVFDMALVGQVREAEQRLDLFEGEPEWNTLARLLIAWLASPWNPGEAAALAEATSASCNGPELQTALGWVRRAPYGVPDRLAAIIGNPQPWHVDAILQRAGGAETVQGIEPIDFSHLVSGMPNDASAFIADQDGPVLVAFARLDPPANTQYLERYIAIHAANRYRYYRNRSLWALLKWVLIYPDAAWVRSVVREIVTAALTVTQIDFEEFLPLTVLGLQARSGDSSAAGRLEAIRQQFLAEAAQLGAGGGTGQPQPGPKPGDSWSHYQRRACALAEVYALALDRPADASNLLQMARWLPKGFAGFRAFSALTLAESTEITAPGDRPGIDAALESAHAASHRIQDYPFCLRATAMVNAMRLRWWTQGPPPDTVESFADNPLAEDFCAVHRVLEEFSYRYGDPSFPSLGIPAEVLNARTVGDIAAAYGRKPETLARVNPLIGIDQQLSRDDNVNIPEPDFAPILAARLSAAALALPGLTDERRSALIQRLVPVALPNPTALDTVLARLLLSARNAKFTMPALLAELQVPGGPDPANASERLVG
jgi:hypothetical protein